MQDEQANNIGTNSKNKGRFVKGDPRCWRKGRPRTFDALRELAQQIAHEVATVGGKPVVMNGHTVTNAEMVMRQWLQSGKPELQRGFMEIAFGKVPTPIEVRDWRKAMQDAGVNPDEAINDFEQVIASKMGSRGSGSGGDATSDASDDVEAGTTDAASTAGEIH